MNPADVAEVIAIGVAAGTIAGMFGVGGGVLFVPVLTLILGLSQAEAEGTSLLAMIPVALVGSIRQYRRGLIDLRQVAAIGAFSGLGAVIGATLANNLPEDILRKGFGLFLLVVASQLFRRALTGRRDRIAREGKFASD